MATRQLTLTNMELLEDGRTVEAFRRHLARAAADCEDRPGDQSRRTVTLQVDMMPVLDQNTLTCDSVTVEISTASKVPPHRSKPYSMLIKSGGALAFNDLAPDNVHQRTIDESEDN